MIWQWGSTCEVTSSYTYKASQWRCVQLQVNIARDKSPFLQGKWTFFFLQVPNLCSYRSYTYSSCNETIVSNHFLAFSYFPHKCQYYCFQLCLLMLLQQSKPQQGMEYVWRKAEAASTTRFITIGSPTSHLIQTTLFPFGGLLCH